MTAGRDRSGSREDAMANTMLDDALKDVTRFFEAPDDILKARDFASAEKIRLLQQWELDLRQLLVASEENMTGEGQGDTAVKLQAVRACLSELGVESKEEAGAPTKAGGGDLP
jgi:hypothetical protein